MKMKKLSFLGLLLLVVGCSSENNESEQSSEQFAPVTVRVSDFSVSVEDFGGATTRASTAVKDYNSVKAITLAFYDANNVETYKTTQLRGDKTTYTTFGEFSCALPVGNYTMVVVARDYYDGDVFSLNSPTEAAFTSQFARETFAATQAVTVGGTTPLVLDVTLNRVIAMLNILSTDGRQANTVRVKTTYSKGGKSFNPTTGFATANTGFSVVNNPSAAAVGSTVKLVSFVFLGADEESMDITIEALDEDENVVVKKVINDVPFKRNRATKLQGAIFTQSASASFKVETDWETDQVVNF